MKAVVTSFTLLVLIFSSKVCAENDRVFGLGGIVPSGNAEFALSVYFVSAGNDQWSIYFDGHVSGPDENTRGYYDEYLNEGTFNDEVTDRKEYYTGLHLGGAYKVNDRFSIYAALGGTNKEEIVYLYDPTHILGPNGEYSLKGDDETVFSVSSGILYRIDRVNLNLGYVSGIGGLNLGIGFHY